MDTTNREPQGLTLNQSELHVMDVLTTARSVVGTQNADLRSSLDLALMNLVNAYEGQDRASVLAYLTTEVSRKRQGIVEMFGSAMALTEDDDLWCTLHEAAGDLTYQGGDDDQDAWDAWCARMDEATTRHQAARVTAGLV